MRVRYPGSAWNPVLEWCLNAGWAHSWPQVDPYPDEDDWYSRDVSIHPLQAGPEPKRRFIPSKWEEKKCAQPAEPRAHAPDSMVAEPSDGRPVPEKQAADTVADGRSSRRRVVKLVRALRKGWIKREADKVPEQPPVYLLWQDDGLAADHTLAGLPPVIRPFAACLPYTARLSWQLPSCGRSAQLTARLVLVPQACRTSQLPN